MSIRIRFSHIDSRGVFLYNVEAHQTYTFEVLTPEPIEYNLALEAKQDIERNPDWIGYRDTK